MPKKLLKQWAQTDKTSKSASIMQGKDLDRKANL